MKKTKKKAKNKVRGKAAAKKKLAKKSTKKTTKKVSKKMGNKSTGTARQKPEPAPEVTPDDVKAPRTFMLRGKQSIANARELSEGLQQACESGADIEIDVSDNEAVDTAIIQVLVALANSARNANVALTWRQPSEALRNGLGLLGLGDAIDLSEANVDNTEAKTGMADDGLLPVF